MVIGDGRNTNRQKLIAIIQCQSPFPYYYILFTTFLPCAPEPNILFVEGRLYTA